MKRMLSMKYKLMRKPLDVAQKTQTYLMCTNTIVSLT